LRDEILAERYGLTVSELQAIRDTCGMRPFREFGECKKHANERKVAWQLSFSDWWTIWMKSGKYPQRGRERHCYVMARHGDIGPYAVGNVSIQTPLQNMQTYWQRRWSKRMVLPQDCPLIERHDFTDELEFGESKSGFSLQYM